MGLYFRWIDIHHFSGRNYLKIRLHDALWFLKSGMARLCNRLSPNRNCSRLIPTKSERDWQIEASDLFAVLATFPPPIARQGSRLNIIHCISQLGPGGAERQLTSLVLSTMRRGHTVSVVLTSPSVHESDRHYMRQLTDQGIEVVIAGKSFDPSFSRHRDFISQRRAALERIPLGMRRVIFDLFGEFLARRPDVVHCWLDSTNIVGGLAALLAETPTVVLSTRSMSPIHFPHYYDAGQLRPFYRGLSTLTGMRLINNSAAGTSDYAKWLNLPHDRIRTVFNGLDPETMALRSDHAIKNLKSDLGIPPNATVVTGIFRLAAEKRPILFLDAAVKILTFHRNCHVLVVGTGPMLAECLNFARGRDVTDRIHFLGRRHDIEAILSISDLLLLTSTIEGTPNVLLEAQWMGVPVITTPAGGAVDAVDDSRSGYIMDTDSTAAIAERALRILSDKTLAAGMGVAGRQFVERRFGLSRMVDETLSLYS